MVSYLLKFGRLIIVSFINNLFFSLPLFLYIKPPDESILEQLLPDDHIWTEGIGGPKEIYLQTCDKLKSCVSILYGLQYNLMMILLNNNDGDKENDIKDSSRKIFLKKFRTYVFENHLEHRVDKNFFYITFYRCITN